VNRDWPGYILVDEVYHRTKAEWEHVARVIGGIDSKNPIVISTAFRPRWYQRLWRWLTK
jgi:hypothetical protein